MGVERVRRGLTAVVGYRFYDAEHLDYHRESALMSRRPIPSCNRLGIGLSLSPHICHTQPPATRARPRAIPTGDLTACDLTRRQVHHISSPRHSLTRVSGLGDVLRHVVGSLARARRTGGEVHRVTKAGGHSPTTDLPQIQRRRRPDHRVIVQSPTALNLNPAHELQARVIPPKVGPQVVPAPRVTGIPLRQVDTADRSAGTRLPTRQEVLPVPRSRDRQEVEEPDGGSNGGHPRESHSPNTSPVSRGARATDRFSRAATAASVDAPAVAAHPPQGRLAVQPRANRSTHVAHDSHSTLALGTGPEEGIRAYRGGRNHRCPPQKD